MTVAARTIRDWSYREAVARRHRSSEIHLPHHTAGVRLDAAGNYVVACRCGWSGNAPGWMTHLDHVVRAALRD